MTQSVVIVGAGILGVTLAWRLARQSNLKITLLDQADAGSGASQHSFAWINTAFSSTPDYMRFRAQAGQAWRQLDQDTAGRLNIQWSGALSWQQTPEQTAAFIQQQQDYGFHVQACTGLQIAQLEPNLKHFPDLAAYALDDGAVPLDHVIQSLLQEAIEAGVNYAAHQRVTSLIHHQNQVVGVSTTHGNYFADQVVLAGGVGNHALLQDCKIDLALTASPSILMKMSYQHRTALLNRIVSTPEMELRVCAVGQVLAAEDYIDAQAQNHPELIAQQALLSIQNNLKASHGLRLDQVSVGYRPMPTDTLPLVGAVPNLQGVYVLNSHAAVTLAPLLCQLAGQEILSGNLQTALAPYRPNRIMSVSL